MFGTFKLASPRLYHCGCKRRKTTTFRPLTTLLPVSVAPELLFMETKCKARHNILGHRHFW
jgi:hypothetical protein